MNLSSKEQQDPTKCLRAVAKILSGLHLTRQIELKSDF